MITNEAHWRVVAHDAPDAFFGVELQHKTAWVTFGIYRTSFATHRGETQ